MPGLARELGIRVHGHFDGRPGAPDAKAARRAVAILRHQFEAIDAVFLIRDADNQPQRRSRLEQARTAAPSEIVIVVGLAEPMREAWVLGGFEPRDAQEQDTLASETAALGFDPRRASHRLTARGDEAAPKNAKRVLKTLTNDQFERQRRCWQGTDLSTLRERGQENGLAPYLDEVERLVAPLLSGR